MIDLLTRLTPLALGAAVSPVLFAATILILSEKDRGLKHAISFALGAFLLLAIIGAAISVAFRIHVSDQEPHLHLGEVDHAFGVLLLTLAARQVFQILKQDSRSDSRYFYRDQTGAEVVDDTMVPVEIDKALPATSDSSWRYFGGGIGIMLLNFSTIVIFIPAVRLIAEPELGLIDRIVGLTYLIAVTMTASILPIVLYAIAPRLATRILEPFGNWVRANSRQIGAMMLFVMGLYLMLKIGSGTPSR